MITCIVFDVGNVLVNNGRFPQSLIVKLAELLATRSQSLLSRYRNLLPKLEANQSPISLLLRRKVSPNLKILYQKAAQKTFHLNKETFDLALKLKRHYQVGIISNVDKYLAEIPLHQKVYGCFDPKLVVLSYKVGTRKPQPEIYRIFLKRSGCRAEEILFVDNIRQNVVTAKKLGMKGIVFKNNRQFKKELAGHLTSRV
jgi:FMN phosphatase YigB (HAD superfamily)